MQAPAELEDGHQYAKDSGASQKVHPPCHCGHQQAAEGQQQQQEPDDDDHPDEQDRLVADKRCEVVIDDGDTAVSDV
jgi:hypothetical protein